MRAHMKVGLFGTHVGPRGRFISFGTGLIITLTHGRIGLRVTYSRLAGRIVGDRASGALRVKASSNHRRKGCDTGRLHWHAHFVPRS